MGVKLTTSGKAPTGAAPFDGVRLEAALATFIRAKLSATDAND